ncbi:retrovirus-related pol polyprotein from transposon TNT 1-94 [Tanacetum coccineum]
MKSITEGPFKMGTFIQTPAEETEGALQPGPERARVFTDLSGEEKERYKADIRATNILLQGIPKDIYTLINHYTDAKDVTFRNFRSFSTSSILRVSVKTQLQEKDNVIRNLKAQVSKMNDRSCETYNAKDVTALIEQNECVRVELENLTTYKELYDSIKITCAHTREKTSTMLNEIESLKAQLKSKVPCVPLLNTSTEASRSKPRSNTKKNRILPAKSENKKKVEDHPRTNNSVNATPTVKIVLNKGKQIWKPKGKLSDNSLNKTKRVWKATGKLFADIGYQWRPTGKKFTLGKLICSYQWRPTGKKFAKGELCPLTKLSVVQVVLWYLDSGCSKHMTGNRSKLKNFVEKFIGTVRFGNDHFGAIMGYGDYVIGDSVISRVYYVEGLGHNLFSVGQFCDSDLEIAFRKHSCFVRDMNGVDLLKGSRSTNLYTISIDDMMKSSPVCLLSKASKIKSWLWHRRLNHLNFGTINDLARKDLVRGLPRLKFEKDHLCSACQLGKSKKYSHKPKSENTNMEVLHTLHMDLCGPMRVQSINGKKYILVIVDDYSRFTWVKFLRSKDETPEFVINFLKQIQVGLNKTVRYIRTDNGTEFVNQVMSKYYEGVGIFHQKSVPRTPQQNGVVERRNRTLVEAARTMLIFSKAPMFLWAEAVATALFGALCYPTNDSEDLGKLQAKADIGIFVGYAPSRKGFRIYNKRTRRIMETIHVTFDELHQTMAPVHISSGPEPMSMTPGQFSSGLIPNQVHATNYVLPTDKDLELLFQPMFDEYFEVTRVDEPVPSATAAYPTSFFICSFTDTSVIDLSSPKPVSPPCQESFITAEYQYEMIILNNFHHQHPHYSKAVQFLKWSSHGSCANQFRTYAFFDDSWIHQFRTRANLSFSNTICSTIQERL